MNQRIIEKLNITEYDFKLNYSNQPQYKNLIRNKSIIRKEKNKLIKRVKKDREILALFKNVFSYRLNSYYEELYSAYKSKSCVLNNLNNTFNKESYFIYDNDIAYSLNNLDYLTLNSLLNCKTKSHKDDYYLKESKNKHFIDEEYEVDSVEIDDKSDSKNDDSNDQESEYSEDSNDESNFNSEFLYYKNQYIQESKQVTTNEIQQDADSCDINLNSKLINNTPDYMTTRIDNQDHYLSVCTSQGTIITYSIPQIEKQYIKTDKKTITNIIDNSLCEVSKIKASKSLITSLRFKPYIQQDKSILIASSIDKSISYWNVKTGKLLTNIELLDPIISLDVCSLENKIAAGMNKRISLIDDEIKCEVSSLGCNHIDGFKGRVTSICFSKTDSNTILAGDDFGRVFLFDIRQSKQNIIIYYYMLLYVIIQYYILFDIIFFAREACSAL